MLVLVFLCASFLTLGEKLEGNSDNWPLLGVTGGPTAFNGQSAPPSHQIHMLKTKPPTGRYQKRRLWEGDQVTRVDHCFYHVNTQQEAGLLLPRRGFPLEPEQVGTSISASQPLELWEINFYCWQATQAIPTKSETNLLPGQNCYEIQTWPHICECARWFPRCCKRYPIRIPALFF